MAMGFSDTRERRRPPSPLTTFELALVLSLGVAVAVVLPLTASPAGADSKKVVLENLRFSPERIDIPVGDAVRWKAYDDRHTVTARNGEFDSASSGLMEDGDEFRWRFQAPGTYPYFCRVHQNEGMQGVVVVLGDPTDGGAASPSPTTSASPAPPAVTVAVPASTATTTATTAPPTTTTTSRPLATSSTMNLAATTTIPAGTTVAQGEPPAFDPDALSAPPEAGVPGTPAALHRHRGPGPNWAVRAGELGGLSAAVTGAVVIVQRRRRRRGGPPDPSGSARG